MEPHSNSADCFSYIYCLLPLRDWIQSLSAYATSNFLRAADLGVELREAWVVVNAAVYLWNYNSHLLAQGEHRRLLAPFQKLVELLKQTGHAGLVGAS